MIEGGTLVHRDRDQILQQTGDIHGVAQAFFGRPPASPEEFKSQGRTLLAKLTDLQNEAGEVGAALQVYELGEVQRLERKSSRSEFQG
jgi:hypothetical protein